MYTLHFDITTEEGRLAFQTANAAPKMARILREHAEWLRVQRKYNNKVWAQEATDHLWSLANKEHIDLWDL